MIEAIGYISFALSIIITIITFIVNQVSGKKSSTLQKTMNGINVIFKMLPEWIMKAESIFGCKRGQEKLDYVKKEARIFALENKIEVNDDELTEQINNVVKATNNVNVGKNTTFQKCDEPSTVINETCDVNI